MVFLGLLLIVLGAVAILSAVFVSDGSAELLGMDLSALTIFLIGVAAGAALIWGFAILKYGTKRELRQRKERKQLNELSEKLDKVEADRRADGDES
ncbi:hypothetical protein [Nocardioides sp.]|uniref:hypothetical protein n=1 Tax=Nocardioides sp. TaxID=35761 RepID=UPI003527B1D2